MIILQYIHNKNLILINMIFKLNFFYYKNKKILILKIN